MTWRWSLRTPSTTSRRNPESSRSATVGSCRKAPQRQTHTLGLQHPEGSTLCLTLRPCGGMQIFVKTPTGKMIMLEMESRTPSAMSRPRSRIWNCRCTDGRWKSSEQLQYLEGVHLRTRSWGLHSTVVPRYFFYDFGKALSTITMLPVHWCSLYSLFPGSYVYFRV